MEETINSIIYQVAMEFQEIEEDFIFQNIRPYCGECITNFSIPVFPCVGKIVYKEKD